MIFLRGEEPKEESKPVRIDIGEARKYKLLRAKMIEDFMSHRKVENVQIELEDDDFGKDFNETELETLLT